VSAFLPLEDLSFVAELVRNEWLLGLALVAITTALVALSVPGVLVPLSFSSGALLGGWTGAAVVIVGAALGSQAFFVVGRRWLAPRLRAKLGPRLTRFDRRLAESGFACVVGLRLAGVPHFIVTAAGALSPMKARSFALATMLGLAPAIALAATAGAAI
jgi:uncharacterized membrane protein YdjX (TVP38/TMEM64 family)